jgi:hypothetical protein
LDRASGGIGPCLKALLASEPFRQRAAQIAALMALDYRGARAVEIMVSMVAGGFEEQSGWAARGAVRRAELV